MQRPVLFFSFLFFNYTLLPVQKEYWALPVHKIRTLGSKSNFLFSEFQVNNF